MVTRMGVRPSKNRTMMGILGRKRMTADPDFTKVLRNGSGHHSVMVGMEMAVGLNSSDLDNDQW